MPGSYRGGENLSTKDLTPLPFANLFVAYHGSWNRSVPTGYKVVRVVIRNGRPVGVEDFATGWLEGDRFWGRPVDVLVGKDGALYVSDDDAGHIYRITFRP